MKVFHGGKYAFFDILSCEGQLYYAFRCTKVDFSPEIVLVRQARVDFSGSDFMFFDESVLETIHDDSKRNSICVNLLRSYAKLIDLAVNERKA